MASSSRKASEKEVLEVQLVSNEVKQPDFRPIPEVAYKNDPAGALSVIPPKVIMVQDVRKCYNCKIGSIGDLEISQAYEKLCVDGILKEEYKIAESKGLTRALGHPTSFKTEWVRLVLSRIHDGSLWLENAPVKITKRIIHRVTGYPTLDRYKTLRSDSKELIEKNTGAKWNKRGMTIDTIRDPLVEFAVRIISHKFYQSSRLNSVPCIAVDVAYKLVKKNHTYDLAELQLQQLTENLAAIRRSKGAQCKFGAILICIFFYIQNEFPSFGKVTWKTDKSVISQVNEYIAQMGDNFEALMTSYFEDFKKAMKQRLRIPASLVEKHVNDVCFLVDIDYTYIQAVIPRVRWLRPLGYEVNIDETSAAITALLAEAVDKDAPHFGTYDVVRSKVDMELKTSSALKKKDKLVKKLKAKFGEGKAEVEEGEESEGPLELTQGMGEDAEQEESAEEEAPKAETKKRKAKKQPVKQPKLKKPVAKPTPAKPTTRADSSKTAQEAKEPEKEKEAEQGEQPPKKRRKLVVAPDTDEEGTESDEDQYRLARRSTSSRLENICNNIRDNADLSGLLTLDFNKLSKEQQNTVEDSIYTMMAKFKTTPLELDDSIPKELNSLIENKWHYCLQMEKDIRESTLARVMPDLSKGQITKASKKYASKFAPKYRAFSILQNQIEDVVKKSTQIWKVIYGLSTKEEKVEEQEEDKDEEENDKEEEVEKDEQDKATADEQQQEQSVQDTQLPPSSPPHVTTPPAESPKVQDIPDTSGQNVNPLTAEDLKKILHQTSMQSELCNNPVLVSVEELQKATAEITKSRVNTQEPPSQAIAEQTQEQPEKETPAELTTEKGQQEQRDTSVSTTQTQGVLPSITIIDKGTSDQVNEGENPKEKEQQVIQILANLPKTGTPTETQQQPSSAVPLQISRPSSSSTKVARILHYGDPTLDEEIVIPRYDYATMTIDQITEVQEALEKKKKQEVLRNEYKQRQALVEIKEIFLDAFSLQTPDETKPIMEQLAHIVEQVQNEDQEANVKLMEWSEKKFQGRVNEKIASEIAISQVELAKKITIVKQVLENIFSLYKKLCDFSLFTQDTSQRIAALERNLNIASLQLPKDPSQSEKYFAQTLRTQQELATIQAEESNIKSKLLQLQSSITPHMEILHKEQGYAEHVIKKDPNLSTLDGLVHLAAETAIQYKSLEIALNNWDASLSMIMEVNKTFLAKYGINL